MSDPDPTAVSSVFILTLLMLKHVGVAEKVAFRPSLSA
jgi:hypothetical protein